MASLANAGAGPNPTTGSTIDINDSDPTLTGGAASLLTADQQQFGAQLAADTGLNIDVIEAWLLSEQSGAAAETYQAEDFNDWLNIGQTGNGDYSNADSIWNNPISAANATAEWLEGKTNAVPGYGPASSGIQSIVDSASDPVADQISALQDSGWASGGYKNLDTVYNDVLNKGGVTSSATPFAAAEPSSRSSSSGGSSGSSLLDELDPAEAVLSVWDSVLSDAKYAGLFILALFIGGYLIVKGIGANGVKMPSVVVPVGAP